MSAETNSDSSGAVVRLRASDGFSFPVYVARGAEGAGAIVLLPEIYGVNGHMRALAHAWARRGCTALVAPIHERVRAGVALGYEAHDVRVAMALKRAAEARHVSGVLRDIQASIDHARAFGPVALIGFSWGGLFAWRAASMLHGLCATVVYYGGGMTKPGEIDCMPRVPVLVHLAEHDHSFPRGSVAAFRRAHPDVALHVYPAQHGFNCGERASWDAASARLAQERTLAFLAPHLPGLAVSMPHRPTRAGAAGTG